MPYETHESRLKYTMEYTMDPDFPMEYSIMVYRGVRSPWGIMGHAIG